jgi:predicted short-subunit dehydrogenase-like oxidoreductase (DUF2520 family)
MHLNATLIGDMKGPVGVVGAGRMAKALGALLARRGVCVTAVAGRCEHSAEDARQFIGAERAMRVNELPQYAGRVVIAVTDGAVADVAAELAVGGLRNGIVLHTSGAAGPDALRILREAGNSVGVLHPLMTAPTAEQGVEALIGAAYAFAGDEQAVAWAADLVACLGGTELRVDPQFWPHYHAAATMACNYQVTLVDAALELMTIAGIERDDALCALGPILRATADNVLKSGPAKSLTGPIRRGDAGTICRHLAALDDASPDIRRLYVAAARRTIAVARQAGLEENSAREIEKALGAGAA